MKRAKEGSDALQSFEENELTKKLQELKDEPEMNIEKTKEEPRPKGLMKGLLAVAVALSPNLEAQDNSPSEEVYELSPFAVDAQDNIGYRATSTLAGTRLKPELRDLGAAISVMTEEFFEDTGATEAEALGLWPVYGNLRKQWQLRGCKLSRGVSEPCGRRELQGEPGSWSG